MPWISKRAKAEMRSRRKKKRQNEGDGESQTKKRKLDKDDTEDSIMRVTIPTTLSSKDARKMRKEARRRARSNGKNGDEIQFFDEFGNILHVGQKISDENGLKSGTERPKKRKKSFPNINQLISEAEANKKAEELRKKMQVYEDSIPEEIKNKHVALDCEMVGIGADGKQSALARVSITGWSDEIILDTFVQVPDRVTDFRTHVSGVRASDISSTNGKAMELHKCRKTVAQLLKDKILVGHSLKNDFAALMLSHPKHSTRDTARYKPFMRASGRNGGKLRPRKLRDLVKEHLGLDIQKDGQEHTSTEDAQATMRLFKSVMKEWEKSLTSKKHHVK
jgi:RNA exonuclease 4